MATRTLLGTNSLEISLNSSPKAIAERSVAVSSRQPNKTVFVELDEKPAKANVVREGQRVPSVKPDANRVDQLLSGLIVTPPTQSPRVLAQSIAPGTKVSVGTPIDLVLAPREDVSIGIFDDVHVAVRQQSVADLLGKVKDDKQLLDLVLKYERADEVEATDKAIMIKLMGEKAGMPIDEAQAGQRFKDGFNAMRVAYAFK